MSTTPRTPDDGPTALPATPPADAPRPRVVRDPDGAWVAGVSTGISRHLGWPLWLVRAGFVALGTMQFVGVFAYALLWVLVPQADEARQAPGLESAERTGLRRRGARRHRGLATVAVLGSSAVLGIATLGRGSGAAVSVPLVVAGAGLALVWRQADVAPDRTAPPRGRLVPARGWSSLVQAGAGLAMVAAAVSIVAFSQVGLAQLPMMLGLSGLMVLGVGIAAAPWIAALLRQQRAAHERVAVEQARADMAAHLHDSVLQTLALIQRRADDPRVVAQVARRQERELRAWLYGDQVTDTSLKAALVRATAEVEDERGIDVELVCVGDAELDDRLDALVRATREAVLNAAKHSGAGRVDVYCEAAPGRVEVFVRDRGAGFDPAAVAGDRMGVRRSIVERMERHGGTARIRSAPGEGTEVALVMED